LRFSSRSACDTEKKSNLPFQWRGNLVIFKINDLISTAAALNLGSSG